MNTMKHKINIVSNGTPAGTQVIYKGVQLPGVTAIDVHIDMDGTKAILEFVNVETDFYDIPILKNNKRKN